jgi:hypothetical protein
MTLKDLQQMIAAELDVALERRHWAAERNYQTRAARWMRSPSRSYAFVSRARLRPGLLLTIERAMLARGAVH